MLAFGNTVHLSNGRTLVPRQYTYAPPPQYTPPAQTFVTPQPQYAPPPTTSPPVTPESPSSETPAPAETEDNEAAPVVTRFIGVLQEYSYWILKTAHPLGTLDSESHSVKNGSDGAVITYEMHWHGAITNKQYITTLQFPLTYDGSNRIETLSVSVDSTSSPFIPFMGAEAAKNMALNHISDRLKEKGERFASLAVRAINSNASVKQALAELLKGLANSQ